jgi:hypothetical protein
MPLLSSESQPSLQGDQGDQGGGIQNYTWGFTKSMLSSIPELIGSVPDDDVTQWREDNPIGGFLSQNITPLGEFGLAARIGKYALRGSEALRTLSEAHPFLGGLAEGTAGMAPIAAARVAGALMAGNDWKSVAQSSLIDTAMQAGFEGVGGVLKQVGDVAADPSLPTRDVGASYQLRARELQQMLDNGTLRGDQATQAQNQLATLSKAIRLETGTQARPPMGFSTADRPLLPVVGDLVSPTGADNSQLNRLFRIKTAQPAVEGAEADTAAAAPTIKRRLAVTPRDFATEEDLAKATADAALPPGYEFNGQFFRHISFANQQAAATTASIVRNNLIDIGDGWFLGKEADMRAAGMGAEATDQGGLYTMAKRVGGPQKLRGGVPVGNAADQWIVFKTDNPGFFKPNEDRFANTVGKWGWDPAEDAAQQAKIGTNQTFAMADSMNKSIPVSVFQPGVTGMFGGGVKTAPETWLNTGATLFAKAMGWGDAGPAIDAAKAWMKENVTPFMHQFAGQPMARKMATIMKSLFESGDQRAAADVYGTQSLKEGSMLKQIFQSAWKGGAQEGGLADKVLKLSDSEFDDLNGILVNQQMRSMDPSKLPAPITQPVRDVIQALQDGDLKHWTATTAAERIAGIPEDEILKHLSGHMSLSRTWLGGYRIPIKNEVGDVVAMASGRTPLAAQKMRQALIDEAAANGKVWSGEKRALDKSQIDDLASMKQLGKRTKEDWAIITKVENAGRPGFFKERNPNGIKGYQAEHGYTRQELINSVYDHWKSMNRVQAELAYKSIMDKELTQIAAENPNIARQLNDRMNQMAGRQGEFARLQNKYADRLLAPFIGHNSASQISAALSKYMYAIKYGFGAMSLPIVHMLNFTQTHFPEMAWLAGGAPGKLADYYSHIPIMGEGGIPRGKLGVLGMWGFQKKGLMELANPSQDFRRIANNAVSNGLWDQRMLRDVVGNHSSAYDHFKEFKSSSGLKKGWAFAKFITALGTMPAELAERLARGQSFAVAYNFGKDFLGMSSKEGEDQALQQFMKEFMNRTEFSYGTADKAKIFQGPLGNLLGQQKNWMFNYYHNMLNYLGEAGRGNVKPLMYAAALPALFGGVPATGGLYWIADKLSRMYGNTSLMERIYSSLGSDDPSKPSYADLIYQGLPGYLPKLLGSPGISLTQQLALPMADPGAEFSWLGTPTVWDQGKQIYKALVNLKNGYDATGAVTPDAWSGLARATMPKTFYQTYNAWNQGMINSATTLAPMMTDLTPMERFYYSMGINPARVALYYDIKNEATAAQADEKTLISSMGREWALAEDTGNTDMMRRVMGRAMAKGLDITKVMASAKGFAKRLNENGLTNNLSRARIIGLQRMTGVNMPMPNADLAQAAAA